MEPMRRGVICIYRVKICTDFWMVVLGETGRQRATDREREKVIVSECVCVYVCVRLCVSVSVPETNRDRKRPN